MEENEIKPSETVVEQNTKKKGPILVIVLLVIVALGVGGYICYDKFIAKKPKTNNSQKENKNGDQKELNNNYEIKTLKSYDLYEATYDNEDHYKMTKDDNMINIEYIIINYDTDSINKFNQENKEYADKLLKSYYDLLNNTNPEDMDCACIKDNDKYGCSDHLDSLEYKVKETSKYLLVEKAEYAYTFCATGFVGFNYYTIDKDSKKVLSNEDILKEFNYNDQDVKSKLKAAILDYYYDEEDEDASAITPADTKELENWVNSANYLIYNDSFYITCSTMAGDTNDYYKYDGTNIKKVNDENSEMGGLL